MRKNQEKVNKIKVFCRFRSLINNENSLAKEIYKEIKQEKVLLLDEESFGFEKIFLPYAKQEIVFDIIGKPMVDDALIGFNRTLVSYGQYNSGKTYTMIGNNIYDSDTKGILPRVMQYLFKYIENIRNDIEITIKFSSVELYKEKLKDLSNNNKNLKINEDPLKGVYIEGLNEVYITSSFEFYKLLSIIESNKSIKFKQTRPFLSQHHRFYNIQINQR